MGGRRRAAKRRQCIAGGVSRRDRRAPPILSLEAGGRWARSGGSRTLERSPLLVPMLRVGTQFMDAPRPEKGRPGSPAASGAWGSLTRSRTSCASPSLTPERRGARPHAGAWGRGGAEGTRRAGGGGRVVGESRGAGARQEDGLKAAPGGGLGSRRRDKMRPLRVVSLLRHITYSQDSCNRKSRSPKYRGCVLFRDGGDTRHVRPRSPHGESFVTRGS